MCANCCLAYTPFVGRGHDPADQVAHFALARFNGSAFITLRFGGVMTPPYEMIDNNLPIYNAAHEEGSHAHHSKSRNRHLGK